MTFNFQLSTVDFLKRHWLTLVIVAGLLVGAWWGLSAWNHARELRLASERGTLQSEISNLRSQAAAAVKRADVAEAEVKEVRAEVQRHETVNGQLVIQLKNLQAATATEQTRIAALTSAEVAVEVAAKVGAAGSDAALRRTLEIIGDRDACREQSVVKDQQFANCRESLVDYAAIGDQQVKQIQELKQALDLERRAFDKRDDLAKVQVKAAKGSWLGRMMGKAKWFVIGVGAGAIAGAIVAR
jgi:hypothetical protein